MHWTTRSRLVGWLWQHGIVRRLPSGHLVPWPWGLLPHHFVLYHELTAKARAMALLEAEAARAVDADIRERVNRRIADACDRGDRAARRAQERALERPQPDS